MMCLSPQLILAAAGDDELQPAMVASRGPKATWCRCVLALG